MNDSDRVPFNPHREYGQIFVVTDPDEWIKLGEAMGRKVVPTEYPIMVAAQGIKVAWCYPPSPELVPPDWQYVVILEDPVYTRGIVPEPNSRP